MKRPKLRQRTLPIDMASILHPVSYERGKQAFARMIETLENSSRQTAGTHDTTAR